MELALDLFTEENHLWLEISETAQASAWKQSQCFSSPSGRWRAYLNRLCLQAFLPWLQAGYNSVTRIWPVVSALPSFWEVVNGTAIQLGTTRLVLIPSDTIDLTELRVPQEWLDIPMWAADYYLAAQVDPDDGFVRIWGYSTHLQLHDRGRYHPRDRTYSLEAEELIDDLNVLWVGRQVWPSAATRSEITPLPALLLAQANNLLERLGNPSVAFPRRALPFSLWGALLEHGGWRQRLYEKRLGLAEQWSIPNWLREGISELPQQIGWGSIKFTLSLVGSRGKGETETVVSAVLSRELVIDGHKYELRVLPQGSLEAGIWCFELHSLSQGGRIPGGFKLRLLTEDLQPFADNEITAETDVDQL